DGGDVRDRLACQCRRRTDDDRKRAGRPGRERTDRARDRRCRRGASVGKAREVEAWGKLVGDRHAGCARSAPVGGPERERDSVSDRHRRRACGLARDEIRLPAGGGRRRWRWRRLWLWRWWRRRWRRRWGRARDVGRGGG